MNRMKAASAVFGLGVLLGHTTVLGAGPVKPNIVVILADDLGYGDPGCYNPQSKIPTPNINSLATAGMRFTDAHAAGPLCHPSRYGLLTGRYPFRTDVSVWPTKPLIEAGQTTLASLLKSQGYQTAMVGKWHLGFEEKGYDKPLKGGPVDCGFDSFFGMRASTDIPPYFYIRGDSAIQEPTGHIEEEFSGNWATTQGRRRLAGGIAPNMKLEEVLPRFTEEAIKVIRDYSASDERSERPLMLYLAYSSPHTPWLPSEEFVGKSGAGLYGDFIMNLDAEIGRVLEELRRTGLMDNTLLFFTSDNGPCWYAADVERFGHDAQGGLRGMKSDIWEAGHRVPFIACWPKHIRAGSVSDQTICFTDLLATFAAVSGARLSEHDGPDSFNFLPVLLGKQRQDTPIRPSLVLQAGSYDTKMIRSGEWKLITHLGSGGFSDPKYVKPEPGGPIGQLYNLSSDAGETNNLYSSCPEIVSRLTAEMQKIIDDGHSILHQRSTDEKQSAATDENNLPPVVAERDPLHPYKGPSVRGVDTSTLTEKVICGYQGWFNCEGDGANLGWTHWAQDRKKIFGPGNIHVDLWPDTSECDPDELYDTGFHYKDGSTAKIFSSYNRKTVVRHFEWMRDYGIDGAFVQRFAHGLRNEDDRRHKNMILGNVREGANRTGRSYAVMYDLTGLPQGDIKTVSDDWRMLREKMHITGDPAYQHHNGKPLVIVWGVGFNDGIKKRTSLAECAELIRFLKKDGCSVMLGVPRSWRTMDGDAIDDPELHEVLLMADVLSPWTPGRYSSPKGFAEHAETFLKPDVTWCRKNNIDYMPVVFPGFSWFHQKGDPLGKTPRLKGEFFWSQIVGAQRAGADMIYVAMFDEVDEGTAIFKCTNNPPTGDGVPFLTYEGLPSDYYLWLAGQAGRLLRGEIQPTDSIPDRKTSR